MITPHCTLVCLYTIAVTLFAAYAIQAATPLDTTVPNSCGMQIKGPDCSENQLDQIKALGCSIVRRGFIWEAIEKKKGQYDFRQYDPLMKMLKERNLRVLGCMAFGNKLYAKDSRGVRTEESRKAYARFAAELVKHYKDYDIIWEIWNEPNTQTFWGKHAKHNSRQFAEEYSALVKETVAAMRKADPNCFVMAGSVSCLWEPSYQWTENCFKNGVLKSGINAWSVHPYSFKCPEDHIAAYERVRKLMKQYGGEKLLLLNSERGFPLKEGEGAAGGTGTQRQLEQWQACHFVRQYLVDVLCDVRLTIWYQWAGKEFGFVVNQTSRPAAEACKTVTEQLHGYQFTKRLPTDSDRDFLLLFEKPTGQRKLVAWTAPAEKQSPDTIKDHDLDVEVGKAKTVTVVDLYGKKSTLQAKNGKTTLHLTGAPQYVDLTTPGNDG